MTTKWKKTKTPAPNLPVPQSDVEAAAAIARLGAIARELGRIKAEGDERLAVIANDVAGQCDPLLDERAATAEGLRMYCEAHRARLTDDGKSKTAKFATGTVSWRVRPPGVRVPRAREALAELVDRLKTLGLSRFLRIKEEVDKEAMLKEPDVAASVQGVSIGSGGEDFVVEPLEMAEAAS